MAWLFGDKNIYIMSAIIDDNYVWWKFHSTNLLDISDNVRWECDWKGCEWNIEKYCLDGSDLFELFAEYPSPYRICFICCYKCKPLHKGTIRLLPCNRHEMTVFLQKDFESNIYDSIVTTIDFLPQIAIFPEDSFDDCDCWDAGFLEFIKLILAHYI